MPHNEPVCPEPLQDRTLLCGISEKLRENAHGSWGWGNHLPEFEQPFWQESLPLMKRVATCWRGERGELPAVAAEQTVKNERMPPEPARQLLGTQLS